MTKNIFKTRIFILTSLLIVFIVAACSPTKSTIKEYTAPEFKLEAIRTVGLIKHNAEYLTENEIVAADEKLFKEIQKRFKDIKFYDAVSVSNKLKVYNMENVWEGFWKNYMSTGSVDETLLFDMAEVLKVNAVLHGEVMEVNKIYGEHRKTIGQTSAKIKYALFSLKSGKLLWEATVTGIQENAHSDQPVPKAIEAVNIAITDVINNLPF